MEREGRTGVMDVCRGEGDVFEREESVETKRNEKKQRTYMETEGEPESLVSGELLRDELENKVQREALRWQLVGSKM